MEKVVKNLNKHPKKIALILRAKEPSDDIKSVPCLDAIGETESSSNGYTCREIGLHEISNILSDRKIKSLGPGLPTAQTDNSRLVADFKNYPCLSCCHPSFSR